jgi:two-component system alkaline phosphatase synthesis response regulator PhoP
MILSGVWGYDFAGEIRTVDMHIKTLRQKTADAGFACLNDARHRLRSGKPVHPQKKC